MNPYGTRVPSWSQPSRHLRHHVKKIESAPATLSHPLQALGFFRHISPDEWRRFGLIAPVHSYQPGNVIFYQGNSALGLHFLCRGRVKLIKQDSVGRCQIMRIASAPNLLGDRAFFAERPYACTGEVMDEADICIMEPRRFWEFFGRNTDMLRELTRKFAVELGRAEESMHCIAVCTVNARLATRLLTLARMRSCFGKPVNDLILTETRMEMAQVLASTPEALSRALSAFCAKGLIAVSKQHVRILNEARLRLIACHHGIAR
ncbi:MAG: Crp/Fnr family transcriptional regulator [Elusimicrobiota bacterium]